MTLLECGHGLTDPHAKAGMTNEGLSLYYCSRGCGPQMVSETKRLTEKKKEGKR